MIHHLRGERKAKNSRVIDAWGWCGHHEPWGEMVPSNIRGVMLRRLYSRMFRPNRMPKDRYVGDDFTALVDCPHCKAALASGKPAPPQRMAQRSW